MRLPIIGQMAESSQTLSRGLKLLDLLGSGMEGAPVREIVETMGLPRSIVQRLLNTLEADGFIERSRSGSGYRLAIKLWSLGCRAVGNLAIVDVARPELKALVAKANETAKISVLDGDEVVSLVKIDCLQTVRAYVPVGGRAPAHIAATGKAILAFRAMRGSKSSSVQADFAQIRKRGYATNHGDWEPDVAAVASPIFDFSGQPVASIGVILPLTRLTAGKSAQIGSWTVSAAAEVSHKLGFPQANRLSALKDAG
jgi:IclR family transcriptional regulator, acetate operon repressor